MGEDVHVSSRQGDIPDPPAPVTRATPGNSDSAEDIWRGTLRGT